MPDVCSSLSNVLSRVTNLLSLLSKNVRAFRVTFAHVPQQARQQHVELASLKDICFSIDSRISNKHFRSLEQKIVLPASVKSCGINPHSSLFCSTSKQRKYQWPT